MGTLNAANFEGGKFWNWEYSPTEKAEGESPAQKMFREEREKRKQNK